MAEYRRGAAVTVGNGRQLPRANLPVLPDRISRAHCVPLDREFMTAEPEAKSGHRIGRTREPGIL
jgi:catechol 2,3-dioxygenase-like lactoylglutathione lyase family enzyme